DDHAERPAADDERAHDDQLGASDPDRRRHRHVSRDDHAGRRGAGRRRHEDLGRMTGTTTIAGRYRIEGRLGVGGMSTVHLAFDSRLERYVALKVLAEALAGH